MKKHLFASTIGIIMASLMLTSCNKYTSHYKAVGFVHSHTSKKASMKFSSFEGTMVFKFKCENDEKINYSAKLESGSANVFYDYNDTKNELFSINSGDDISNSSEALQKGTVYIIIETSGTCEEGSINFEIK